MTVKDLEEIFARIIGKLKYELGEDSEIKVESDIYRIIPTEKWNRFDNSDEWNSAKEIDLGSLKDDVEELNSILEQHKGVIQGTKSFITFKKQFPKVKQIQEMDIDVLCNFLEGSFYPFLAVSL